MAGLGISKAPWNNDPEGVAYVGGGIYAGGRRSCWVEAMSASGALGIEGIVCGHDSSLRETYIHTAVRP
jgi:hypothetical protein